MHAVVRRVLLAGAIAGGAVVGGAAAAQADGLLSGNDVGGAVVAPVQVCGIGVAVLGDAAAGCDDAQVSATTDQAPASEPATGPAEQAEDAVLSGNDLDLAAVLPVQVCGVAVAVGGDSSSSCDAATSSGSTGASGGGSTSGEDAVASGNDVDAVAVAPVQVCGISVGVLGDAEGSCGEASTEGSAGDDPAGPGTPGEGSDDPVGSGNDVDLSGSVAVQVCGIAAGVLGDASGGCVAGGSNDPTGPGTDPADPGSGSGDGDVLGDEVVADRTQARAVVQASELAETGASLSRTGLLSLVALVLMALGGLMVRGRGYAEG